MLHLSTSLSYYKREDVRSALAAHARDKEVAVRFNDRFGRRPDVMRHPGDILPPAQHGASSFHCSEELWRNPLQLSPQLSRDELDRLRKGWDLILDIDCAHFEYSRIAAQIVLELLQAHGISSSLSVKFSGNKGFHIGVPFEAFPETVGGVSVARLFPEAPRRIAAYIKEMIKEPLGQRILSFERDDFAVIVKKTGKQEHEIISNATDALGGQKRLLNAEPFLVIDTVLISSRHLYRMPYALHEKSGLVSLPLPVSALAAFDKTAAIPENTVVHELFLDRSRAVKNEAAPLFVEAFDFSARRPVPESEVKRTYNIPDDAIPEQCFPDCIKKLLAGLEDGRKRAAFILINFLASCGWSPEAIEQHVRDWNTRNKEPLREVYLVSQLRYAKQQNAKMPPNCANESYYKELGVKCDESVCSRCRNPVNCAKKRHRAMQQEPQRSRKKKQQTSKETTDETAAKEVPAVHQQ